MGDKGKKHVFGIALMAFSISLFAGPLELVVETYPIDAPNPSVVMQALDAQAPRAPNAANVIIGWTQFQWGAVSLQALDTANGCAVQSLNVEGRAVTHHPRLVRADSQDWANRFEQFATTVRQHEHKHVQIYNAHWNALQSELNQWTGRTQQMTCQTLKGVLERRLSEWDKVTSQDHQQLDAREGHFDTQSLRSVFGLR
jgi:predicted secreted Zn-dependent protease